MVTGRRLFLAILVTATVLGAAPAEGLTHRVTTVQFRFIPDRLTVFRGDSLVYTNADFDSHSVTTDVLGPDGKPVFGTPIIGTGESAQVVGVDSLEPGSYPFYCAPHPWMTGTLDVVEPPAVGVSVAQVSTPTSVAMRDSSLYVASRDEGAVYSLPVEDHGLLGAKTPYVTGLERPLGIAFDADGTLFVSDSHASTSTGRERDGRVWAVPPGGGDVRTAGQVVLDRLPTGRNGTNGLAVSDGRLYVANGTSTDNGASGGPPDQPLSGVLMSVPTSARGLTPADLETEETTGEPGLIVEAQGLRNPTDVAFRPSTDEAWMPSTGPHGLDPFGEDLLYRTRVSAAPPDFGFPACVYRSTTGTLMYGQNPAVTERCDGTQSKPETAFGLDTSAAGLAFGPDDPYWRGDIFVGLSGKPGEGLSDPRVCFAGIHVNCTTGHRVVRVPIDAAGRAGQPTSIFAGGDPADVAFGPQGLYVADLTGRILLLRKAS